jgi:3-methyladenine DNA glycosylase/8-oxoguanine DNA glycosylase
MLTPARAHNSRPLARTGLGRPWPVRAGRRSSRFPDLFGALVFQIIGQQISVIAATATVLDLAQRFSDGRLAEAELRELPDQEVIRRLTEVKGIGAWTVQGALLIALQRRRLPFIGPAHPAGSVTDVTGSWWHLAMVPVTLHRRQ